MRCHPSWTLKVVEWTNSSAPPPPASRGYHTTVTGGSPKSSRVYAAGCPSILLSQRVFSSGVSTPWHAPHKLKRSPYQNQANQLALTKKEK